MSEAELQHRIQQLEHQLAQAAETERHLRAYRAPLRKIAELERQIEMMVCTAPDQLASRLQQELTARAAEISELKKRCMAQAKQIKAIERVRVEVAERDLAIREAQRVAIAELKARVAELEALLSARQHPDDSRPE